MYGARPLHSFATCSSTVQCMVFFPVCLPPPYRIKSNSVHRWSKFRFCSSRTPILNEQESPVTNLVWSSPQDAPTAFPHFVRWFSEVAPERLRGPERGVPPGTMASCYTVPAGIASACARPDRPCGDSRGANAVQRSVAAGEKHLIPAVTVNVAHKGLMNVIREGFRP